MKQKSMGLGSTLTRTETKLVGGNYKYTATCTTDSECTAPCSSYASTVCSTANVFPCYTCVAGFNYCFYRTDVSSYDACS